MARRAAFYVTFSGERDKHGVTRPLDQVVALDARGHVLGHVLTALPAEVRLDELRGLAIGADGALLVANANKARSQILAFSSTINADGLTRDFIGVVADPRRCAGLDHPYAIVADRDGALLVSSQDSGVVSRLPVATAPLACAPALTRFPAGRFLAGTWVACARPSAPDLTTVPPALGGLALDPHARHSVRGLALADGVLYVADQAADRVATFDAATGTFVGAIAHAASIAAPSSLRGPVGLAACPRTGAIYIGSAGNAAIFRYTPRTRVLAPIVCDPRLDGVAGLAVDPSGTLFIAARKRRAIYVLDGARLRRASARLTDTPECLLSLPD